jgi:branched-chain amino acid transport system permease protein
MMFNLRDWGAGIWERSGRPVRVLIALGAIAAAASLPFLGGTFLNTPVADYGSVLVFPVAIFVIMALGLNIVIGKSGLLDLGYVAFFAIGAYTMGLLGTKFVGDLADWYSNGDVCRTNPWRSCSSLAW